MNHLRFLLVIFSVLSLLSGNVIAQGNEKNLSPKKKLALAKEYFRVEEYHHSFDLFKELLAIDSENPEYNYYLGVSKLFIEEEHKADALDPLLKVESSGKSFPYLYFYLGRAYHLNHDFNQAIAYYKKHLDKEKKIMPDNDAQMIDYLINQCEIGKKMVAYPINVEIYNLGDSINTEAPEIAPVVSADETRLIFTSRRKDSMGGEIDPMMGKTYEDIYIVEKNDKGEWGKPKNIGAPINTKGHDASIGLSPDGQELFIYKDEYSATTLVTGSIYKSVIKDGKWSMPEKLQDGINSRTRETHATITPDEKIMIFTSSRQEEGSLGGIDLYMVRRLPNLEWAKPINLGNVINTKYDEESPFLHPNGKILYFSSKGHDSMGGFDIFYSEWDEKTEQWSKPKNVGYPINTADDDIFYSISADGMRGYFTSVREESRGGHDLYVADVPSRDLKIIALKGKVFDKDTQKPLDATIVAVNNEDGTFVSLANSNNTNGRFSLFLEPNKNYGIRVIRDGYLFKSLNINVPNQFEYLELDEIFYMQKNGTEKLEVLNNVFFQDETSDLMVTSDAELEVLKDWLKTHPEYIVEIAVHTDNTQDKLVALYSTQAKADAIVGELKKIGVDGRRVVGKGYGFGFNYPIATNLTTMGRLKNNRIEYIIRENKEGLKDIAYEEINEVFKENEEFAAFQCPKEGDLIRLSHKIDIHAIDNTLNANAVNALDEAAAILDRCKDIEVEIGGHTDNKGHEPYNIERSEKKAQLIKQQLVYRGIASNRMIIKGYGSSKPVVDNSTQDGREANNRIELKVIKGGGNLLEAIQPENLANKDLNTLKEDVQTPLTAEDYKKIGTDLYSMSEELGKTSKELAKKGAEHTNTSKELAKIASDLKSTANELLKNADALAKTDKNATQTSRLNVIGNDLTQKGSQLIKKGTELSNKNADLASIGKDLTNKGIELEKIGKKLTPKSEDLAVSTNNNSTTTSKNQNQSNTDENNYSNLTNRISADNVDVSNLNNPQRLVEVIYFDFNSSELTSESKVMLERVEKMIRRSKMDDLQVIIEGHTDNVGSEEYNKRLGERRARVVKQYLRQKGIEEGVFVVKSLGESNPSESNDTKEGRNKNRRAEFIVKKIN
jgi:outer membrane protein OmpA-like peptidoglycan-associated protein